MQPGHCSLKRFSCANMSVTQSRAEIGYYGKVEDLWGMELASCILLSTRQHGSHMIAIAAVASE